MKNNQLKQTKLQLKNHKHKDAMHDPKQPPHLVILRIISGLEWVEHIMDIMDLAIQWIEPLIAIVVMFILRHIELMQLVQHHPFKIWLRRASILRKIVGNQVHGSNSWFFLLICTTWTGFMVMCTTTNSSSSCSSIYHLDKTHFVQILVGGMVQ